MKKSGLLFLAACVSFLGLVRAGTPLEEDATLRKLLEDARDFTKGKSEICPVHKVKMAVKEAAFQNGLMTNYGKLKDTHFPYGWEFIPGGCTEPPAFWPKTGKIFVCPQCVVAWNRLNGDIPEASKALKEWDAQDTLAEKKAAEANEAAPSTRPSPPPKPIRRVQKR